MRRTRSSLLILLSITLTVGVITVATWMGSRASDDVTASDPATPEAMPTRPVPPKPSVRAAATKKPKKAVRAKATSKPSSSPVAAPRTKESGRSATRTASSPSTAADGSWRLVGEDHFDSLNESRWGVYEQRFSCCQQAMASRSLAKVADGALQLSTAHKDGEWMGAGVSAAKWPVAHRTYGRVDARLKMSPGRGNTGVALLWPSEGWPPEMDYWEVLPDAGDRREAVLTNHWKGSGGEHKLHQKWIQGDFTQWHEASVRWTPSYVENWIDGRMVRRETRAEVISKQSMWPGFQIAPDKTSDGQMPTQGATLSVDWIKIYEQD